MEPSIVYGDGVISFRRASEAACRRFWVPGAKYWVLGVLAAWTSPTQAQITAISREGLPQWGVNPTQFCTAG